MLPPIMENQMETKMDIYMQTWFGMGSGGLGSNRPGVPFWSPKTRSIALWVL